MEIKKLSKIKDKNLIIFDLDGTLIRTKSPMDREMIGLIKNLLLKKKVAVIGGGKYLIFQELFVDKIGQLKPILENLFLFPVTGTSYYKYKKGWKKVYALSISPNEASQIKKAFEAVFNEIGYSHPKKTYGEIIEHRGSAVGFSVYGQDIVKVLGMKGVQMKEKWLRDNSKLKMRITKLVAKKLPNFEVRAAGFTTIDVTRKGIDKSYGIHQMKKYLKVPINKMLFVGDAIFRGGNDYAVVKTGVDYIKVKNPEDTKKIIKHLLSI
jgi:phosphomannomutase